MTTPPQTFTTYVNASPERIWDSLTNSEDTTRSYYGSTVESSWQPGESIVYRMGDATALDGIIIEADRPRRLVHTLHLQYRPEVAAERPSRYSWELESTFEPGDRIAYRDDEGVRVHGEVIEAIPSRRLAMTWAFTDAPLDADAPSRVTWDIEPVGNGARVRVTHDRFEGETPSYRSSIGPGGWPHLLDRLRQLLEEGQLAG